MMKKATAVLDFGTSKVLVLLAEESAYQKVTITSAGMAQYDGFMNGEWNAPSEVSDAIASAIEAAEKKVGTHIKEVYVGVPGEFVRVYVIESSVALQGADPKVTSADVEKLQRQATEMLDRPTGVIIHRSPAWFKVDGGQKTLEPVDQKGSTLEGMIGFVLADQFFINDVTERLKELGVEVNGYADLLQPELVGKIASADPASSSSAFCQLTNMLLAMGGYEDDAAWKYVEDLFVGQQVAITSGSSAVYKGVYNGEYAVGLTYEDPCVTLIKDGATNIQVVYPVEGTVFLPAQIGIVKNAKNVENAKAFVDFMLSEDAQRFLAENTTSRNVREVEYKNDVMTPLADIKLIYEDSDYVIAHTSELKEKVQDIMMDM